MTYRTNSARGPLEVATAGLMASLLAAAPALGAPAPAASPAPAPTATPSPAAPAPAATPTIPSLPFSEPEVLLHWSVADASALLSAIAAVDAEGLIPADYQPDALRAAIQAGEGEALDRQALRSFTWLVEDLRDGRTPVEARTQWFAKDPDQDQMPTATLLAKALETHDVPGVLAGLAPRHANYAALRAELAATPAASRTRRAAIRANMDRWRWLPLDLGQIYLIANLPEFQLRLMSGERLIRNYRIIIGKPGKTQTPELYELVKNVVFNPTWTVPQSIVQGEGLGPQLLANPARAVRENYKVTKNADGTITVVQQPGPNNALGLVKIDMPNPHAIYMHDTPNRNLFNAPVRAFSHGCMRTEDAMRLAITMAILGAGTKPEEAVAYSQSGQYTKVAMTRHFPVYITYFTLSPDSNGRMTAFNDIYGRDAPVLAAFAAPRKEKTAQRTSDEEVVKLDNPL